MPSSVLADLSLTKTEQAIFQRLAANANMLVSRHDILAVMKAAATHTIDSHIMSIRQKLRRASSSVKIETVVGKGFILRDA